jgi:hypothetical protein
MAVIGVGIRVSLPMQVPAIPAPVWLGAVADVGSTSGNFIMPRPLAASGVRGLLIFDGERG